MQARFVRFFLLILTHVAAVDAAPPRVVMTWPDTGETDVAPDVKEIRIQFDQPMDPRGRSVVGGGDVFPQISGALHWVDAKAMVIPVTLAAEHRYQFSINSDTFKGFCNKAGEPAEWYPVTFATRAAGAVAAPADVTPQQNKLALMALSKAIDEDYSYRDLMKLDWAKRIEDSREKFETATTANEFARLTAHLLREAQDGHISVQAGETRIYTHANSMPPNVNVQVLRGAVPGWAEKPSGIATGRFDDGIGYILISSCTTEQANAFDAAMDELKDTKGLIIDARLNGGGDEEAARRVASRFVEKAAVYSKDRIRQDGKWTITEDRLIEPGVGKPRYQQPVAVLIGPKVVSSAESFVLMMKTGGQAKLIGSATGGSSGRPLPHDLGNGVTVYLPSWEDQLPDGNPIQNRGVEPDIQVDTTPRGLMKADAVLEASLKYLRNAAGKL